MMNQTIARMRDLDHILVEALGDPKGQIQHLPDSMLQGADLLEVVAPTLEVVVEDQVDLVGQVVQGHTELQKVLDHMEPLMVLEAQGQGHMEVD